MTILAAILFLGILIFVHELGHFVVARIFRVHAPVLSLGFGRRLVGVRLGSTDYRISLVPFGGYVRLRGADPFEQYEEDARQEADSEDAPRPPEENLPPPGPGEGALSDVAVWKRLLIYVAGPVFNLLLPFVLFVSLALAGEPQPAAVAAQVFPDGPAAEAGIRPGDRVLEVEGIAVETWADLWEVWERVVPPTGGEPVELSLQRGEEVKLVTVQAPPLPEPQQEADALHHQLGIGYDIPDNVVGVDDPASPAGRAGIRTGDRVVEVGGEPVEDWLALSEALQGAGGPVELAVEREGEPVRHVTLPADGWQHPASELGMPLDPFRAAWERGLAPATVFVGQVVEDSAAMEAGLQVGDHVMALDGEPVWSWLEILEGVDATTVEEGEDGSARSIQVAVVRDGAVLRRLLEPDFVEDTDAIGRTRYRPLIGIGRLGGFATTRQVRVYYGLGEALVKGWDDTVGLARITVKQIGRIVSGEVAPQNSLGGPVEIVRQASNAAESGLFQVIRLLGMISISVGIFNLLPVPVLDGGHILFYTIEAIRGRPVSVVVKERFQMVGVMLLAMLMLFVLVVDLNRAFGG